MWNIKDNATIQKYRNSYVNYYESIQWTIIKSLIKKALWNQTNQDYIADDMILYIKIPNDFNNKKITGTDLKIH